MIRPLKHLQTIFINLFAVNMVGFTILEIFEKYAELGWFYGLVAAPSASSALTLLIGYNLAFWVVRQSFHMHIPLDSLSKNKVNLVSSTVLNICELFFTGLQFAALMYTFFYPLNFPLYRIYLTLAATNLVGLGINLFKITKETNLSFRSYYQVYAKLVSSISLLVLIFSVYESQLRAAETP